MPTEPLKPATRTTLATAPTVLLTPSPGAAPPRRPLAPRSRVRRFFALDHLRDLGGTLLIVVPLTILIWWWAEREQAKDRSFDVPLKVVASAGQTARITSPAGASIRITLSGPNSGLDAFQRNNATPEITVDAPRVDVSAGPRLQSVSVGQLLSGAKEIRDAGLTLNEERSPTSSVTFEIDQLASRELDIRLPPELANLQASIEPRSVTVEGSRRLVAEMRPDDHAVLDFTPESLAQIRALRPGQTGTLVDVPLRLRDQRQQSAARPVAESSAAELKLRKPTADQVVVTVPQTLEVSGEIPYLVPLYVEMPIPFQIARAREQKPPIMSDPDSGLKSLRVVGPREMIGYRDGDRTVRGRIEDDDVRRQVKARVTLTRDDINRLDAGETLEVQPQIVLPEGVRLDGPVPSVRLSISPAGGASLDVR